MLKSFLLYAKVGLAILLGVMGADHFLIRYPGDNGVGIVDYGPGLGWDDVMLMLAGLLVFFLLSLLF